MQQQDQVHSLANKAVPFARSGDQLPADAAVVVDAQQFLPLSQLKTWQEDLDKRGLRATGGKAHEAYVSELFQRLQAAGVTDLYYEEADLTCWQSEHWALAAVDAGNTVPLAAASYIPYSGATPPLGIKAPSMYLAAGELPGAACRGKIVVVDIASMAVPSAMMAAGALSVFDPNGELSSDRSYLRPYIYMAAVHRLIVALQALGAAGMVAITDAPHSYIPYDRELHTVPGLFVDQHAGATLRALARDGRHLHLTLLAQIAAVKTRNLIGFIPGATEELVVINSHTDGSNGVEDNGPNAIVDMAQYLTRLPREALPRTVMIMLSTGHFAGGVGIEQFIRQHRDDGMLDRIAAVLSIEHLGAMEWLPDAQGKLAPTGLCEPAAFYMPAIDALVASAEQMQRHASIAPSMIMRPTYPLASGTANDPVWPGEGQYFWGQARLPTINYITGPHYLLDWGPAVTTADKIDFERMHRETVGFTQLLLDLARIPFDTLRPALHVGSKPELP